MNELVLEVTEQDIAEADKIIKSTDKSSFIRSECCPVAQSAIRHGLSEPIATFKYVASEMDGTFYPVNAEDAVKLERFISDYDRDTPVKPMTINLKLAENDK